MISSWSTKTKDQLSKSLNVDLKNGISDEEAFDRLVLANKNRKKYKKELSSGGFVISYLSSPRFIMGIVLSGLVFYVGQFYLSLFFVSILLLDFYIWFKRLSRANSLFIRGEQREGAVVVIRSGRRKEISSSMLVVGDLVELREGDMARVAMRVVSSDNFSVSTSSYSDNSKPIAKNENVLQSGLAKEELSNIVFPGDFVSSGRATLLVLSVVNEGNFSNNNSVTDFVKRTVKNILVFKKLTLKVFLAILSIIILLVSYFSFKNGFEVLIIFFSSLFLFSSEAFSSRFLKILNQVLIEMSGYSAILRNVNILEKLKGVNFVVLDKTGVFVEEDLKLSKIYTLDSILDNTFDIKKNKEALEMTVLSSELLLESQVGEGVGYGSSIDRAIIAEGLRSGINYSSLERLGYRRLDTLAFSREKGFSATLYDTPQFPNRIYFSGEPIKILSKSNFIWRGNTAPKKTAFWQDKVLETIKQKSKEGFKIVAISYKDVSWRSVPTSGDIMQDSVFVGLVCFSVRTKKGVSDLIEKTKRMGVKVLLVSGDYPEGVSSFARELGIVKPGQVLTGKDLEEMRDEELFGSFKRETVYASVSGEQRLRIVNILKDFGETVLVVGEKKEDLNSVLLSDVGVASSIAKDIIVDVSDVVSKSGFAGVYGVLQATRRLKMLQSRFSKMFIINSFLQCIILSLLISAGFSVWIVLVFMFTLSILGVALVPKDTKSVI